MLPTTTAQTVLPSVCLEMTGWDTTCVTAVATDFVCQGIKTLVLTALRPSAIQLVIPLVGTATLQDSVSVLRDGRGCNAVIAYLIHFALQ